MRSWATFIRWAFHCLVMCRAWERGGKRCEHCRALRAGFEP